MRIARIAAVTAGLVAAGAVVGAVAGVAMCALMMLLSGELSNPWSDADLVAFTASFGARVGAVLGPVAAWLLMRHVPLGRAIGGGAPLQQPRRRAGRAVRHLFAAGLRAATRQR